MSVPFVSIIVPAFNVAPFLPQCIDSIIKQSFRDFEIIIVDDGSKDGTGGIADRYRDIDSRVKVIHKKNGGLSDARNAGMKQAEGVYLLFLDSDDYLYTNVLQKLKDISAEYNPDMVIGNYSYLYDDHEDVAVTTLDENKVYDKETAMTKLIKGEIQTFAWGKIIRRTIAERYQFPVGKHFEDHFWTHLVLNNCESICALNDPVIHYRQRAGSISFTFDMKRLDIIDGWRARIDFLEVEYPDLLQVYLDRCADDSVLLAWQVLTRVRHKRKKCFHRIREFTRTYKLYDKGRPQTKKLLSALNRGDLNYGALSLSLYLWGRARA